jgi:ankyrin repeat protein
MSTNLLSSIEDVFAPTPDDEKSTDSTVEEEALECDYDRDCTSLYLQIEKKNFSGTEKFLKDGFWPGAFFADTLLPSDQAMTWVTRFEDGDDTKNVKWSQLPLHLAVVVDAPAKVIVSLVELYPQGVRCTDDQHMLPLHLAMRHGSSDEVVEYLLRQFPEAVNAKGRNDRTPLECAKRSPNTSRANIIQVFVEKYRDRAIKNVQAQYEDEIKELEQALWETKAQMQGMEKERSQQTRKINELKNARLVEGIEAQTKIENLSSIVHNVERGHSFITKQRRGLAKDLSSVEERLAASESNDDLEALKNEVKQHKKYRLENSRSQAREELEAFKVALEADMKMTQGKSTEEIRAMRMALEQLRAVNTNLSDAKSTDEVEALKANIDDLRNDVRTSEDLSKARSDVIGLKKQLEKELREPEGKSTEELRLMKTALRAADIDESNFKSVAELNVIKRDLENVKGSLQEKELLSAIKRDIEDLKNKILIEIDLTSHTGEDHQDLLQMQAAVNSLNRENLYSKSKEQLTVIARELDDCRVRLFDREDAMKMIDELDNLKAELSHVILSTGDVKSKRGFKDMKKDVEAMSVVLSEDGSKSKEEWRDLKAELLALQQEVKEKKEIAKIKHDLVALKKTIDFNLKHSEGSAKEEVRGAKKVANALDLHQLEGKGMQEILVLKGELTTLEHTMALREVQLTKKLINEQIDFSENKTGEELRAIRRSVEMIGVLGLEDKTTEELHGLKLKLEAFKAEIPEKKKKGFKKFFGGGRKSKKELVPIPDNPLSSVISVASFGDAKDEEVETFLPPSLSYYNEDSRSRKNSEDEGVEAKLQLSS